MRNINSSSVLKILFALLLLANGVLLFQNISLKSQLKDLSPQEIEIGDVIADLSGKDLKGNVVSLVNSGNQNYRRVLLYFHPTCGFCKKQMPYWNDLISKTKHKPYKFIALTTEGNVQAIEHYLELYKGEGWNVWIINPEDALEAKLTATPITVVLGSNDDVERVWIGMWNSKEILEVERYFGIDVTVSEPHNSNAIVDNFNANISKHPVNTGNFNVRNFNANISKHPGNANNFNVSNFNANVKK